MENDIIGLYSNVDEDQKEAFLEKVSSTLQVKEESKKTTYDDEWLQKMELTIRYLDNILRNPNRFIVNDEEIVKIELARRITVESIKHLAKNTNLIQSFDEKTGEVKPSKILNINKEESFNTYENRFIYSLINNMKLYIERKKGEMISDGTLKGSKFFGYDGSGRLGDENLQIHLTINSRVDTREKDSSDSTVIMARINKVEEQIRDLCSSEVYKNLAKLHVSLVTSPIKKKNLILKNTNFQYALELWNYLKSHMEISSKTEEEKKDYQDQGELKKLMDQSFLLNALILLNKDVRIPVEEKKKTTKQIAHNLVDQLLHFDDSLSLEELKKIVGEQFAKVKYKKVVDTSEIERTYKEAISEYVDKTDDLRVGKDEK